MRHVSGEGAKTAGGVTLFRFHFYHLGAKGRQHLCAERAADFLSQVQDPYSFKRTPRHQLTSQVSVATPPG
jgi:hypothetical protein